MRSWCGRDFDRCDRCGVEHMFHRNQFGLVNCAVSREDGLMARCAISVISLFLTLGKLHRAGLPLDPRTPIQKLIHVVPAAA